MPAESRSVSATGQGDLRHRNMAGSCWFVVILRTLRYLMSIAIHQKYIGRSNAPFVCWPYDRGEGMTTALGHIRVLDLSRILVGPWATHKLAAHNIIGRLKATH